MDNILNQVKRLYNQGVYNVGHSPIGQALVNTQHFIESPQKWNPVPQFQAGTPQYNIPQPLLKALSPYQGYITGAQNIGQGVLNLPGNIINPMVGEVGNQGLDIGRIIGHGITDKKLPQYKDLKSGLGKLTYNINGINTKPQEVIANMAETVQPYVYAGLGQSAAKSTISGGLNATQQGLLKTIVSKWPELASSGAKFGLIAGLVKGRDAKDVEGQLIEGVKQGVIGAAVAVAIGSLITGGAYEFKKLKSINENPNQLFGTKGNGQRGGITVGENPGFISKNGEFVQTGEHAQKAIEEMSGQVPKGDALTAYMGQGNIRTIQVGDTINFEVIGKPTHKQLQTMVEMANGKHIFLDITNSDGIIVSSGDFSTAKDFTTFLQNKLKLPINKIGQSGFVDFGAKVGGKDLSPEEYFKMAQEQGALSPEDLQALGMDTRKILTGATPKERGFITSVKEGRNTPQQLKETVTGSYLPKDNSQLKQEALKIIRDDPFGAEQMALNPRSDVDIQVGNELINSYGAKGDFVKAKQIAEGMANSGTDLGRAVQAFSQYDKTSPEGAIQFAQSKINEYNRINPKAKLDISNEEIKQIFDQAHIIQQLPQGRERNIAANELMNTVNDLIPSSIGDKAITVWKAGLLTSLRTHERNILGNSLHQGAEITKDIPATFADKVMSLKTGERTTTFTTQGLGTGAKKGFLSARDIIKTGYDPEQSIAKYDVRHVTWGNNPVEQALKKYTDVVFRTLGAADKPFWNAAYARSLYDQAGAEAINAGVRGDGAYIEALVQEPTEQMLLNATKDANVATFHDASTIGKIATGIKQSLSKYEITKLGGEIIAPFTGVPSSIANQMVNYSPAGLIKGVVDAGKVMVSDAQIPQLQRQASQEIGRGVIGSGLLAIGAYLMKKGLLTGQPKDAKESDQWTLEGKQPNSILIGGRWRSIGSIGPENLLMLAGAKAQEELNQPDASLGRYLGGVGKDFLGQTFLRGVQQPLSAFTDPARYGTSYIGSQLASFVPNFVKDWSKSSDPYVRENNSTLDYVKNAIPYLRNQSLPLRDNLGNPIVQEPTGVNAFFDLFNSKTPISNPVVDELSRLKRAGENAAPSDLTKNQTIQGVKMTLTPEQLNTLEAEVGPQVTQALQQLFESPEYQLLSDQDKSDAVSKIVSSVRKGVRGTIDIQSPILNTSGINKVNTGQIYTLIDPNSGSVRRIDISQPILQPRLIGDMTLDKLSKAKYNSAITSRINDIYALWNGGKITDAQAIQSINALNLQKYSVKKLKVPKSSSFKSVKMKSPKFIKLKAFKLKKLKTLKPTKFPRINSMYA